MLLKNCRIVSSKGVEKGDISVDGGIITSIGQNLKQETGEKIDVNGGFVMPGVIDSHVHVRDFEEKIKEDYISASKAALAGGVTTILEMPNTKPPINNPEILKKRIELGEKKSLVDFGIHIGYKEGIKYQNAPAAAVKVYLDSYTKENVEEYIDTAFKMSEMPLSFHCEDPRIITRNQSFATDAGDFLIHSDIREEVAEHTAVEIVSRAALKHKKHAHLCHVTLPQSVENKNTYTTCEVTPHHLLLTEIDLKEKKGIAKTNPPLRTKLDVLGLWKAVKSGKVDIIASDHAPHTLKEKKGDAFNCPSGIPNLDIMLKLMLDLVNRGSIGLSDLVRMMCENPAKIFQVPKKGFVAPGMDADLLVLDMNRKSKIDPATFYSKAKYSPFEGRKIVGDIKTVISKGEVAFENGHFHLKQGAGRYLYRQV